MPSETPDPQRIERITQMVKYMWQRFPTLSMNDMLGTIGDGNLSDMTDEGIERKLLDLVKARAEDGEPYKVERNSPLWGPIESAIWAAQENGDIEIMTPVEYIVGPLVRVITSEGQA